jgi:hypothetical protein
MADKNPEGRPTKYRPDYARMAFEIIRESGFVISKLCKVFAVSKATIYNWMDDYPEFLDSLGRGRDHYEGLVIHRSLVRRATGYRYTETTQEPSIDEGGGLVTTKKIRKTMPPDVSAIKHWQVNRDPDHWKDKKHVSGDLTISKAIEELEADGRPKPQGEDL